MHPHHAPFFRFREVTSSLAKLTDAEQVLVLKFELLHALERAGDAQNRFRALQLELDRLKAEHSARSRQVDILRTELRRQLDEATRQLATTRADGKRQVHALRLEILSMENQCQTLDAICRSLLLTIEHAACPELANAAPTQPTRETRISA